MQSRRSPSRNLRRKVIWALVAVNLSSLLTADFAGATDPTAPVSLSSTSFASIYMDSPFVQASYAQTDASASTETFDSVAPVPSEIASSAGSNGNCPDNVAVGTFSPTNECLIYQGDPWFGGATTNSSEPVNSGSHSSYAATHHGPLTITFPASKTYVGFWWSAGSYGNKVSFLDAAGNVVAQLNADDIYNTVTAGTVTAVDGVTSYNSGDYLGHPGDSPQDQPANTPRFDSGEPFVYIHAFASAGKSFKALSLEAPGNGFEFDNLTTADSISINPRLVKVRDIFTPLTLPAPTPNSGYDFGGWYSDSGLENYLGQSGDPYYPPTSSSSIYPSWNPHWVNVYYHDPTNSDYYCNIGGFYNDPYNPIVFVDNNGLGIYCGQGLDKPNSKIVAWNTSADGSGDTYSLFAAYAGSGDLDLYPVWAPNTFALSSVPTGHGTITPSGVNNVNSGTSPTYVMTPETGYHIVDVRIDGVSKGPISTYTFPSVSSDQTISATFGLNTYTVNAIAGAHGSITPNGNSTVNYGETPTYTIRPDSGYQVDSVRVNSKSVGAPTTYTFSPVNSDETITVNFVQDSPPQTPSSPPIAKAPETTIQIPATSDLPVVVQTPKNASKSQTPKRKITVTQDQAKTVISISPRPIVEKPKILVGNSDISIKGLSENQYIRVTIKDPNGNTEIALPKSDSEFSQLVNSNQKSELAIEITPTLDGKLKKGARIGVSGAKRADRVRVIIK